MKIARLAFFALALTSCGSPKSEPALSATAAVAPWEDCVALNPNNLTIQAGGGGFTIVDGSHALYRFDNLADAKRGVQVLQAYDVTRSCFVGRPNPSMKYVLARASAVSPVGNLLANEDCIGFNRQNLEVKLVAGRYKVVDGNHLLLDFENNLSEAQTVLKVIQEHKFDEQCFVRRPHAPLVYWKSKPVISLPIPVTKSSCSTHVAQAGTLFQCPSGRVIGAIRDEQDVFGAFETVSCCALQAAGAAVSYGALVEVKALASGGTADCGASKYVTGVSFGNNGRVQSVLCRDLKSSGKAIVDFGAANSHPLVSHGSAECSSHAIAKALADTITADGDVDTLRCGGARRLP